MKTTKYYIMTALLFCGLTFAYAGKKGSMHGHGKHRPDSARQNGKQDNSQSNNEYAKPLCNGIFIQDLRLYNIGNQPQLAMSFVPEIIGAKAGYMGFKVGDKVKWGSPVDKKMMQEYGNGQYISGTINMLDSDKCYIMIDHSSLVAVKPYEDIVKINP